MPTPRAAFGITVVGLQIFTIGGTDANNDRVGVVEYYDTIEEKLYTDNPLPVGVNRLGAVTIGNNIYILGGVTESGDLPDVYVGI